MIERLIKKQIIYFAKKFPVVMLTGPRQSGKSTLLRNSFPKYHYVSMEEPDVRAAALADPRSFLDHLQGKTIIDEAQHVPELFSYIQTRVDAENSSGMYILSGSQNFLLMQQITQSLAGRTAVLKLLPFSFSELQKTDEHPETIDKSMLTGGYPRIYDKHIKPAEFYPNYLQTYVERDVRQLRNIANLSLFIRFLKLCAGRIGQILNISSLANDCGIKNDTAQAWLSALETSYIIFQLKPYYKNFNKRLIKSPKLYFYDTGLACSLLSIENTTQLNTHFLRGSLFENWAVTEYLKQSYAKAKEPEIYFWRDSNGNEIDLLIEQGGQLQAVELKSNSTMHSDDFKGLRYWQALSGVSPATCRVVYTGSLSLKTEKGLYVPWKDWAIPSKKNP
ncbi:MAG: ATP-binding protein [Prevotellaceae bacterium]|jgi:predicted AAA+ superfamily ATPase|nr:ATP-binding protein [Prevotellaceae bacterium]